MKPYIIIKLIAVGSVLFWIAIAAIIYFILK